MREKIVEQAADICGVDAAMLTPNVWAIRVDEKTVGYVEFVPDRPRRRYEVIRVDDECHHYTRYCDHALVAVGSLI